MQESGWPLALGRDAHNHHAEADHHLQYGPESHGNNHCGDSHLDRHDETFDDAHNFCVDDLHDRAVAELEHRADAPDHTGELNNDCAYSDVDYHHNETFVGDDSDIDHGRINNIEYVDHVDIDHGL